LKITIKAIEDVADTVGRLDGAERTGLDTAELEVAPPHTEEIEIVAQTTKRKEQPEADK
jgi:hypothetical protein